MISSNINQVGLVHKHSPCTLRPRRGALKTNGAAHSSMGFTEDRKLASWSRNAALISPHAPFPPHVTHNQASESKTELWQSKWNFFLFQYQKYEKKIVLILQTSLICQIEIVKVIQFILKTSIVSFSFHHDLRPESPLQTSKNQDSYFIVWNRAWSYFQGLTKMLSFLNMKWS